MNLTSVVKDKPSAESRETRPSNEPPEGDATQLPQGDRIFRVIVASSALFVLGVPALLVFKLALTALPAMRRFGAGFITSSTWDPVREQFGAWPFIYGTVVSSLLALLLAVPVAMGVAVFVAELGPRRIRAPLATLIDLLAAVPSVVYGFWGLAVLVPWLRETIEPRLAGAFGTLPLFQGQPVGFGLLAAALVLAIMIVPTMSAIIRELFAMIPRSQREAAIALGATPWEVVRVAVVPSARSGIMGAVLLGLGRALGETMAVAMVIGNRPVVSASLFSPAHSMASVIANEFAEAEGDMHLASLAFLALLLFAVAFVMNLLARLLVGANQKAVGAAP